jgi:Calcineurin-like phosphoesterase/Purple acid Phosphatase, N-terminal domain/Secretion system C-terminal sorting domain
MRHHLLLLLVLLVSTPSLWAQTAVVDRYPYIQQPTETSALIAWHTQTAAVGTLAWGDAPGSLTHSLQDVAATQKHALTISGLQPNTRYYYQVTTDAGYSSAVEHFWTAKPIQSKAIKFLHYADCGYNNTIQNTLSDLMGQEPVDFAVVAGDVDQGVGDAYDNVFFGVYKNMLARSCHYTAVGNHDIIANGGTDFYDSFYQPTNNAQQSEHYYSFSWGNAKFICLDSNGDYSIGSDQHNFLLDELKCRDQEWLFVFMHHPPWTNAWDLSYYVPFQPFYQYDGNDDMRTALVPYFEQYGVDFVLNGHAHCYQRGELNGIHYVISGGGGTSTLDQHTCQTAPANLNCAPNIQQELYVNEYVRFTISGDTAAYATVDLQGHVIDTVTVIKNWTPYSANFTTTGASGAGMSDGSASIAVAGPHAPYTYAWSTGATTSAITGIAPGTYTVTVTDAFGCTRVESTTVGIFVGLADAAASQMQIYPNPFSHRCRIDFPNGGHRACTLQVLSIDGKELRHVEGITGSSVTLEADDLKPGIYMVQITGRGIHYVGKVVLR